MLRIGQDAVGRVLELCAPHDRRAVRLTCSAAYEAQRPLGSRLVLLCDEEAVRGLRRVPRGRWWGRSVTEVTLALSWPCAALSDVVRGTCAACQNVETVCVEACRWRPMNSAAWVALLDAIVAGAPSVKRVRCADSMLRPGACEFPHPCVFTGVVGASLIEDVMVYSDEQPTVPRMPDVRRIALFGSSLLGWETPVPRLVPADLAQWVALRFPAVQTVVVDDEVRCARCFDDAFAPRPNGCAVRVKHTMSKGDWCDQHGAPRWPKGWWVSPQPGSGEWVEGVTEPVVVYPGCVPLPGPDPVCLRVNVAWLERTRDLLLAAPAWVGRCTILSVQSHSAELTGAWNPPLGEDNVDRVIAMCAGLPALEELEFYGINDADASALATAVAPVIGPRLRSVRANLSENARATLLRHCPWLSLCSQGVR